MSASLPSPTSTEVEVREQPNSSASNGLVAGRFEIVRLLGDGSFAVVYEAIDRDLGRRVALKLFTSYVPDEIESALREARAMARLNHENVLAVHDIGEHRGTPFLAIEFAQMDLRRWLGAGARDVNAILDLFCQAGRGLEAAHRAGLVHHDFKPANVLLRANGTAAVGDFGLARHLDTTDGEHNPVDDNQSYALGTLRYIAPERLLGLPGDERSDQFSFCVTLWEALASSHPFTGADAQRRLDSIAAGPSGTPRAPAHVVRALRRGLSVDAYDRHETMTELLAALTRPHRGRVAGWLYHHDARGVRHDRRGARPLATTLTLCAVFALGVGLSREAPALDVEITPPAVLTANVAIDAARTATFDGDYNRTRSLIMNAMPVIRDTDVERQHEYLASLEVLGDLLFEAGAFPQATMVYAAGNNLASDLGLDQTRFLQKRSLAQVQSHAMSEEATRGK
jgi:hypothetical protein